MRSIYFYLPGIMNCKITRLVKIVHSGESNIYTLGGKKIRPEEIATLLLHVLIPSGHFYGG